MNKLTSKRFVVRKSLVGQNQTIEFTTKKGKVVSVDLGEMGYDKLLGTGSTKQSYKITISAASAKAVEKIEAAGGEVLNG